VATDGVLPLKDARRDAIANLKWFLGPRDTSDLVLMVSFTFTMRRHPIRLASAPFTSSHLTKFGWVPFATCNAWQQSRTYNLRRVGENSGSILTRFVEVHEIFRRCRRPLVLSKALVQLCMSRFVQKIFAIKFQSRRKPNQCKRFLAPNFWEARPRLFYSRLLARFAVYHWAKFD